MNIKQYRLNKETLYRELYKWTHWTHGDSTSNKLYKYLSWYNKKYLTEIFDLTLEGIAKWQCLEQTYQHASLNQTMSFSFKLNDIVWKLPLTFEINFISSTFIPLKVMGARGNMILDYRNWKRAIGRLLVKAH